MINTSGSSVKPAALHSFLTNIPLTVSVCLCVLLQVGDILTQVESVDEDWILGVLNGKRGIIPKNYISFL